MPTYTVRDPQTGKTVKLTGDSPPTEAELTQIFSTLQPVSAPTPQQPRQSSVLGDVAGGLRSSVARTVFGGGDLIRRGLGMERVVDRPAVQEAMRAPDSTAGKVASLGADVGQFFLPTGVTKYKKAAEVAKAGALSLMQSGSPIEAGASAAITALVPGGAAVSKVAGTVKASAEKSMAQALGATTGPMKDEAAKLARPMLEKGVRGSRAAMLEQARATSVEVGQRLNAAYKAAQEAGETVSGDWIVGSLRSVRDGFTMPNMGGHLKAIPGTEPVIRKLDDLSVFVMSLGPDIPIDKAVHLKRTWDDIVSSAGLFGAKATSSSTDNAAARAIKAASDSFRQLLNRNPTIAELNAEASFWTGLKKVLTATQKRTQAQGGGIVAAGMGGSGAIAGALSGSSASDRVQNAVLGGLAGRQLVKTIQSPYFRTTVSGPLKDRLADALASGSTERVLSALGRISASVPAQLSTATGATR